MSRLCVGSHRQWADGKGSFRAFYDRDFRPTAAARLSANHLRSYDQAVATFETFAGKLVRPADVTDDKLAAFVAAGDATGRAAKHRLDQAGLLRQVVLAWDPDAVRKTRCSIQPLPPAIGGTVRHYFETVYAIEAMVGTRDTSIENTRISLRALREFTGKDLHLSDQTDKIAAGFFRFLLGRGVTAATVNRYRRTWFAVWRHAFERGLVASAPRVKRLKEVHNPPDAWGLDEIRRLVVAAGKFRHLELYGEIRCNLWWHALLLSEYYTALRYSSLMAICREHVDLKTGQLYVPGENMKNRNGQMFQLGADAVTSIENIWLPRRVLLFECPHSRWGIQKHFGQLLAAAELPPGRRKRLSKFHKLRRTVATLLAARAGAAAASALLGHSSAYVTARYIDQTKMPAHDVTTILPNLAAG